MFELVFCVGHENTFCVLGSAFTHNMPTLDFGVNLAWGLVKRAGAGPDRACMTHMGDRLGILSVVSFFYIFDSAELCRKKSLI